MNSKLGKQSITDYMTGVGAGKMQSQAGEILTMASVGMNDEKFDGFINPCDDLIKDNISYTVETGRNQYKAIPFIPSNPSSTYLWIRCFFFLKPPLVCSAMTAGNGPEPSG